MAAREVYLDFHTHLQPTQADSAWAVRSISLPSLEGGAKGRYYTAGLHPWDTARPDALPLVETQLARALSDPACLAVGEIGLDRLRGAPLPDQVKLFELQLAIAQQSARPVVIHCVRAWSELEAAVRRAQFGHPLALHGFQGHCPILERLLGAGWYVSVKPRPDGTLPGQVATIPEAQLLLETDGAPIPIAEVYRRAASMRQISTQECSQAALRNASAFFNTSF